MEKILAVSQLGKGYQKHQRAGASNFRHDLLRSLSGWQTFFRKKEKGITNTITALSNVSFALDRGDVLGVIGRNGAGKTTLLKILAGIVQPGTGTVIYRGNLLSILDVGTGFHPDLTGKENVYLSGSLLGMSKKELDQKFESIVAFSELEAFINEPVKNYSNGMYLRLAFSVATQLEADILLLDEVISVGDFPFRQKCYQQISRLARSGTTIIMVSHYPDQIKDLCNKCLWLEKGSVKAFGATAAVLENYLEKHLIDEPNSDMQQPFVLKNNFLAWPDGLTIKNEVRVLRYGLKAKNKKDEEPVLMTDDFEIEMEFEKLNSEKPVEITISIRSMYEAWVLVDSYGLYSRFEKKVQQSGRYSCTCLVPAGILNTGIYQLGFLVSKSEEVIYQNPYLLNFNVHFQEREGVKTNLAKEAKSILKPFGNWQVQRL